MAKKEKDKQTNNSTQDTTISRLKLYFYCITFGGKSETLTDNFSINTYINSFN